MTTRVKAGGWLAGVLARRGQGAPEASAPAPTGQGAAVRVSVAGVVTSERNSWCFEPHDPAATALTLELREEPRTWRTVDGQHEEVRPSYCVALRKTAPGHEAQGAARQSSEIDLYRGDDGDMARGCFERSVADLERSVGLSSPWLERGAAVAPPPANGLRGGRASRVLRTLGPWFGGAALVVLLAFAIDAGSDKPTPARAVAESTGDGSVRAEAERALAALPPQLRQSLEAQALQAAAAATGGGAGAKSYMTHVQPSEMASIVSAATSAALSYGTGPDVLYVFEDVMCPACRSLAGELKTQRQALTVRVIPVAFQSGAMDKAAKALCAKAPAEAWASAMTGSPASPQALACEEGRRQLEANNRLFEQIGLQATPTLVSSDGRVAQGSADGALVARWAIGKP